MNTDTRIFGVVLEALTTRGFSDGEGRQIISRLVAGDTGEIGIPRSMVFPFGKYEGNTVDEVLDDSPQYLHWLASQDWFRRRYPVLYEEVVAKIRTGKRRRNAVVYRSHNAQKGHK